MEEQRSPKPQVAGSSPAAPATLPAHNEGAVRVYEATLNNRPVHFSISILRSVTPLISFD